MSESTYTFATIAGFVGQELGVSRWVTIDQAQIQAFADCTGDQQWIHVDVERARNSPLGTTIVHGYLTLSLLPMLAYEMNTMPADVSQALNYGADKIRFLAPVPSGSRVRNHVKLVDAREKRPGQLLITMRNTIEIEGQETPAMIADTLTLLFE